MRDFTKSMFSFSWAMSLFGVQQAANLFMPSKATKAFDNVTEATKEQFDGVLKAAFRSGDNMQRGMVDMMLGVFTGQAFNPCRWTRMTADVMQQSAEAVGQGMRGAASDCRQNPSAGRPRPEGWGPAPGPTDPQNSSQP
jgi:hypothetical protein